jgi:hypothetical protein
MGAVCSVQGSVCRMQCAVCRLQGAGCRVRGAGCRVQGAGCRVQGSGCGVHPDEVERAPPPTDRAGHVHLESVTPRDLRRVDLPGVRYLRTTSSHKCAAVLRRAHIYGSQTSCITQF